MNTIPAHAQWSEEIIKPSVNQHSVNTANIQSSYESDPFNTSYDTLDDLKDLQELERQEAEWPTAWEPAGQTFISPVKLEPVIQHHQASVPILTENFNINNLSQLSLSDRHAPNVQRDEFNSLSAGSQPLGMRKFSFDTASTTKSMILPPPMNQAEAMQRNRILQQQQQQEHQRMEQQRKEQQKLEQEKLDQQKRLLAQKHQQEQQQQLQLLQQQLLLQNDLQHITPQHFFQGAELQNQGRQLSVPNMNFQQQQHHQHQFAVPLPPRPQTAQHPSLDQQRAMLQQNCSQMEPIDVSALQRYISAPSTLQHNNFPSSSVPSSPLRSHFRPSPSIPNSPHYGQMYAPPSSPAHMQSFKQLRIDTTSRLAFQDMNGSPLTSPSFSPISTPSLSPHLSPNSSPMSSPRHQPQQSFAVPQPLYMNDQHQHFNYNITPRNSLPSSPMRLQTQATHALIMQQQQTQQQLQQIQQQQQQIAMQIQQQLQQQIQVQQRNMQPTQFHPSDFQAHHSTLQRSISAPSYNMDYDADSPSHSSTTGDSPISKSRFKVFYRDLWLKVRSDPESAHSFAVSAARDPCNERIQWKICMEIADLAKRHNQIQRARKWYSIVNALEPTVAQGWIEHAKMEEECGELIRCQELMEQGLQHCEFNEPLLMKCIKHYERLNNLSAARSLLSRLKDASIEKVWRTILEGALMESRAGENDTARRVFKVNKNKHNEQF